MIFSENEKCLCNNILSSSFFISHVIYFLKGKIVLRVSDGQLYSEDRALYILVIPKNPPFLWLHEPLLAFLDNETTIGPHQVDIRVDGLEDSVSITVLGGMTSFLLNETTLI